MTRKRTGYRMVRLIPGGTMTMKRCRCGYDNHAESRVCRRCGGLMVRGKRKAKPRRGTPDRLAADLRHAAAMADRWASRAKAAVTTLHYWNRRERTLAARLAAGPQAPRPKRPKAPRRVIAPEQ